MQEDSAIVSSELKRVIHDHITLKTEYKQLFIDFSPEVNECLRFPFHFAFRTSRDPANDHLERWHRHLASVMRDLRMLLSDLKKENHMLEFALSQAQGGCQDPKVPGEQVLRVLDSHISVLMQWLRARNRETYVEMQVEMDLPTALREAIDRKKHTQAGAADTLGVTVTTIKNWLNGSQISQDNRELVLKYCIQ